MDYWGGQRVCWPPTQIIGGGQPPGPPSSYAYVIFVGAVKITSGEDKSRKTRVIHSKMFS